MKIKLPGKKDKDKTKDIKQMEKISVKQDTVEVPKKESTIFQIPGLHQYTALMKLRIAVGLIFLLCTISMIFIFLGGWEISAVLLLIGYIFLFILLIKLFIIKKL
jgi:hypothetical protein